MTHEEHQHFDHDKYLADEVKNALLMGTESAGIDVQVSAGDGTVRLSGVVDVLSHKRAAEEIARKIPGVQGVTNDITVADEEHKTDKHVQEAVASRLSRNDRTRNIGCRVHKGVVTLVGHANDHDDIKEAIAEVEAMAGVREVKLQRVKVGEGRDEDDADVARAADRLLEEMGYDHQLFEVYCDAGVLFVKGFVPTKADKSRIKTEMHKLSGVDKLEATLITDDQFGGEIH